jgi:hypothetical protein
VIGRGVERALEQRHGFRRRQLLRELEEHVRRATTIGLCDLRIGLSLGALEIERREIFEQLGVRGRLRRRMSERALERDHRALGIAQRLGSEVGELA